MFLTESLRFDYLQEFTFHILAGRIYNKDYITTKRVSGYNADKGQDCLRIYLSINVHTE